jgi:hypothetical protein
MGRILNQGGNMKKWIGIIALFSVSLFAQEQTLLDGELESGGFGGPVVKFSQVMDEFAVLMGGRGGWIINHKFAIGGGGYGLVNSIPSPEDPDYVLSFGYGGVELTYIIASDQLVHTNIYALIGGGGVDYVERDYEDENYSDDTFFIVEPGVDMIINVTSFFRFGLGLHYRFIAGVDYSGILNNDLAGPSVAVTFNFGHF